MSRLESRSSSDEPMESSSYLKGSHANGKRSTGDLFEQNSDLSDDDEKPLAKRPKTNGIKEESDSEDDAPLAATRNGNGNGNGHVKHEESSDSDAPLTSLAPSVAGSRHDSRAGSTRKRMKDESDAESSDDDSDVPLTYTSKSSKRGSKTATPEDDDKEEEDDDEDDEEEEEEEEEEEDDGDGEEDVKASAKTSSKKKKNEKAPKSMSINGTGDKKWETLIHKGPKFPEPYKPLPKEVTLKYDGRPVRLPPPSEEVAMFYAVKLETQHATNPVFNKNFFEDFKAELKRNPPLDGTKITSFDKLDFREMYNYWKGLKDAEAERKKAMAPSARKREIEQRKAEEAEFKTCLVDGVEQKVGNVTVEPPGLFLGRGAHPKAGRVKKRIMPEDITINHSKKHPVPKPPTGKWGEVVEKKDVTWLAYWKENINNQTKYVFLDATSNFKTNSDREKFEKARRLDKCVKKIRADVNKNLKSKNRTERQVATIVWLIDNFSLRAGNEKGEDEAETYGVCSLRCEHARIIPPNQIHLEFLGKDSMKFEETLTIGNIDVFRNISMFLKTNGQKDSKGEFIRKKPSDPIFCAPTEINKKSGLQPMAPDTVNKFLGSYMKGLSAKVFRTYNASVTFQGLLDQTEAWLAARPKAQEREINPANLRIAYNEANRQVAILCNHQKTVNPVQLSKTLDANRKKIFAIKYDIYKERQKLLTHYTEAGLKKSYPAKEHDFGKHWGAILAPVDIDTSKFKEYEEQLIADKKTRLQAAFERQQSELKYQTEQAKLKAEEGDGTPKKKGKKVKKEDAIEEDIKSSIKNFKTKEQVKEELKALDDQLKVLAQERKSNKSQSSSCNPASSARKILGKFESIKKQEAEIVNKSNTSDVALGTSKINYIDPRVTLSWLKKWDRYLVEQSEGKGKGKGKGAKKGGNVKKEEEEEDVKPAKKGTKGKAGGKVKKEEERGNKNSTGDSEKMELGLKIMNIGQFFPLTLQKKFKWAANDDDGKDISEDWSFVSDAQSKMRRLESADRKGEASSMVAMTNAVEAKGGSAKALEIKPAGNKGAANRVAPPAIKKKMTKAEEKKQAALKAELEESELSSDDDDDMPLAAK
ncbi:hypothetical protein IE53DRAFT_386657 [Violaceomyces palustris]|uniref:Uncharacterized protein n=1 Tax=Violaceomyces palustris TaxID=1673888 RepID=A0ACD0NYZ0_9BASI|nr:hypothetical protein IE53DRAFT_386657 [Violaceomyces palustris]